MDLKTKVMVEKIEENEFTSVVARFPKPYVHNGMKNVGSNPIWCTKNSICQYVKKDA